MCQKFSFDDVFECEDSIPKIDTINANVGFQYCQFHSIVICENVGIFKKILIGYLDSL